MRRLFSRIFVSALLVLGASCAEVDSGDARSEFVRATLAQDNAEFFEREPEAAAEKLTKMSSDIYAFFRGTARLYATDFVHPGPLQRPTDFANAGATRVQLVGDAHIENLGSYSPNARMPGAAPGSDGVLLDYNDFDAATYGPYWFDVRRLALSFEIAGQSIESRGVSFGPEVRSEAVRKVARSYVREIERMAAGKPLLHVDDSEPRGTIVDDLFRRARRDGRIAEELDDYTRVVDGARHLFFGTVERAAQGYLRDEMTVVSNAERARVEALIADYERSIEPTLRTQPVCAENCVSPFTVRDVARRRGAGVSSYPVLRYYVLLEGPTRAIDDDWLLEVKEIRDVPVPLTADTVRRPFASNAERVVLCARRSQTSRANDPLLGWASDGVLAYRVRERTKYQKNIGIDRITDQLRSRDFTREDLIVLADLAGRVLARSHAQAPTLDGHLGLDAIARAVAGHEEAFTEEVAAFVDVYAAQTATDFAAFRESLDRYGDELGYVHSPSDL